MSEFDEKLNALLSDPGSMAKIMELAQSLGGPAGGGLSPPPQGPPPAGGSPSPGPSPGSGGFPSGAPSPPPGGGMPDLGALFGGLDPAMLARLLPLAQELGGAQNSQAAALLFALQPYLKPERQDKVERALQLARLFRVGKKFLLRGDGHV